MVTETDLRLGDGRTLHVYDTGADGADGRLTVFWHHGTPNIGAPPEPLFAAANRLGIRWVSYDRPGYGGSTHHRTRDVASAAAYVSSIADALGIDRFAVMGHSGGGPHALACGALLPERVLGVVSVAGLAPFNADGLDWFAGMAASGAASLRAAAEGRAAKERYEASADEDADPGFVPADLAALEGEWSWFISVVRPAIEAGPGGLIDDDLAYVAPWGFDPARVTAPTLLLHGGRDRVVPSSHGEWLARRCPSTKLWLCPGDGHRVRVRRRRSRGAWSPRPLPRTRPQALRRQLSTGQAVPLDGSSNAAPIIARRSCPFSSLSYSPNLVEGASSTRLGERLGQSPVAHRLCPPSCLIRPR